MSKGEVIAQYQTDYHLFLETRTSIPKEREGEHIFGTWRINELVAHIAYWNLETLNTIQKIQAGEIPWFFDDEEKINAVNQEVTDSHRNTPLSLLLQELERTHGILIGFLQALPENEFHRGAGQTWKNQEVTPSLVYSYRHYLAHAKDILEWLETGKS